MLNVNIQGRIIETTAEHPFYEYAKGWIEAAKLEANDRVRTDNGWQQVDEVYDTGIYETVYNLRVADFHTYFVGDETWGFGVRAHNEYRGGPHGETSKPKNDGLESHHMPAKAVSGIKAKEGVSAIDRGPAIQMAPLDHARTSSNGKMAGSRKYRTEIETMIEVGDFRGAMAKEIRDVRRAAQEVSGDRTKYNQAMMQMLVYARNEGFILPNPNL